MSNDDWFLSAHERGNPFTRLAYRHEGRSYTSGNAAHPVIHGVSYFARLHELIDQQEAGDILLFTDWRGDPNERVGDGVLTIMQLIADAAARGVIVKALFWRSHLDAIQYSEAENRSLADGIRRAGGEVLLDERVPPLGSHHQKLVVLRHPHHPERDVAFAGGIDLCHTRRDDEQHHGDPQPVSMGKLWGPTPAWHDLVLEVHGPAIGDIEASFRERWEDPTPLTLDPISRLGSRLHRDDEHGDELPPQMPDPGPVGSQNIQVLRTYAAKIPRFPFAPRGERSIARAYDKAVGRAEGLVYLEDQYFWSGEVISCFARALADHPDLHLIVVLAASTTADTALANASALGSRRVAMQNVLEAGGDRVGIYSLENDRGIPVYVHAKVCTVDDVWMTVGSDNVNRRSWTYDSELTCAVLDDEHDPRAPHSLRADGDPVRRLPRETRLRLAREHLGREDGDDADLVDPVSAFTAFRESAARLDAWHASGRKGPRPAGRLRTYGLPEVPRSLRAIGKVIYDLADDPDGRPRSLRGTSEF